MTVLVKPGMNPLSRIIRFYAHNFLKRLPEMNNLNFDQKEKENLFIQNDGWKV